MKRLPDDQYVELAMIRNSYRKRMCAHFSYLNCLLYARATLYASVLCGPTLTWGEVMRTGVIVHLSTYIPGSNQIRFPTPQGKLLHYYIIGQDLTLSKLSVSPWGRSDGAISSSRRNPPTLYLTNPYKPSVPFLGHRQTVQTQIRRRRTRRLIRIFTVC